jgi:hypothetical protein
VVYTQQALHSCPGRLGSTRNARGFIIPISCPRQWPGLSRGIISIKSVVCEHFDWQLRHLAVSSLPHHRRSRHSLVLPLGLIPRNMDLGLRFLKPGWKRRKDGSPSLSFLSSFLYFLPSVPFSFPPSPPCLLSLRSASEHSRHLGDALHDGTKMPARSQDPSGGLSHARAYMYASCPLSPAAMPKA